MLLASASVSGEPTASTTRFGRRRRSKLEVVRVGVDDGGRTHDSRQIDAGAGAGRR